jgi:tRNA(Arg) A34 adenosine deaminase TadA
VICYGALLVDRASRVVSHINKPKHGVEVDVLQTTLHSIGLRTAMFSVLVAKTYQLLSEVGYQTN